MKKQVTIDFNQTAPFSNHTTYCIGTGRMGLALHKEYLDQLKLVQDKIGFSYIRGHGLFCDDMAIFHEYKNEDGTISYEYNFTYLDRVFDSYLELRIKPFLELGFMPEQLASGTQTIFYWKGNTTPPKDYNLWTDLVKATLRHLISRYGESEVLTWPVEVWNEPNLPGFWEHADRKEYFKLYTLTAKAVKEVNPGFQVGGPAICGGADEPWMIEFLAYCQEHKLPLDFISRHHYTTDIPQPVGHYGYVNLTPLDETIDTLKNCKTLINQYPEYKDLPFRITEFNTSYIPNAPLHDTNQNAAYIAWTLSQIGDICDSYSYWTFGDVFEEHGVPFTPFHGGFGLVANHCIPKPTFWTFEFFKHLQGTCRIKNEHLVFVQRADGSFCGVAWNEQTQTQGEPLTLTLTLPGDPSETKTTHLCLIQKVVDEETCNPLKIWHDLGEPADLTKAQIELLKDASTPAVHTTLLNKQNNAFQFELNLTRNSVIYFELSESQLQSDRGYDYNRVIK